MHPQEVILYQVGDLIESASFNNFLDALDAAYCTSDGGDDPVLYVIHDFSDEGHALTNPAMLYIQTPPMGAT